VRRLRKKKFRTIPDVYFLYSPKHKALKIGVGGTPRRSHLTNATVFSKNKKTLTVVDWQILKVARFRNTSSSYIAEARVLYHWRVELKLKHRLTVHQMGYYNYTDKTKNVYSRAGGHTETVDAGKVCEKFSWDLVLNSPGFEKELVTSAKRNLRHNKGAKFHKFDLSKFISHKNKRKKVKKVPMSDVERFWSKVEKTKNGCWIWTGAKSTSGYGMGTIKSKNEHSHRIAWKLLKDPIKKGEWLNNECKFRHCVNPDHWSVESSQIFPCITAGCKNIAHTTTKAGLCESCRQRKKRARRKARLA
jgi:hypothetical protein